MELLEQQVASLAAAVAQLELALRESAGPAHATGEALVRLGAGVGRIRAAAAGTGGVGGLLDDCRQLQLDVDACIEHLQFYDRMSQHLSHVRDFMSGATVALAGHGGPAQSVEAWELLRVKLRQRLISQPQRDLLDMMLRPVGGTAAPREPRPQHAEPGSVELF